MFVVPADRASYRAQEGLPNLASHAQQLPGVSRHYQTKLGLTTVQGCEGAEDEYTEIILEIKRRDGQVQVGCHRASGPECL